MIDDDDDDDDDVDPSLKLSSDFVDNFKTVLSHHHAVKPRSLMETLLVAKMEAATLKSNATDIMKPLLTRTDSVDSYSSFGSVSSSNAGSEYCRCDDCLLGIVDVYDSEMIVRYKKVSRTHSPSPRKKFPRDPNGNVERVTMKAEDEKVF